MSRAIINRHATSYLSTTTTTTAPILPRILTTHHLQPTTTPTTTPRCTTRHSSHTPLSALPSPPRKRITLQHLTTLYTRSEPITMLTAHDFPTAHAADHAGVEMILVGDSLAMVALGMDDTSEVTLDDMILHARSVARGAKGAFVVGDLPMGCYEVSEELAVASAVRMVKEGRVAAVKLEGGEEMAGTVGRIVRAGIPVLGHVGLTPQRQNALGGFRVQGKSVSGAVKVLRDARAVEAAGAFAVVLEAVPREVAELVTRKLRIPTIGIGAGNGCSGQVLVQMDMVGFYPPGRRMPKFVKQYGDVWGEVSRALKTYCAEVKDRSYPAEEHTYPIAKAELEAVEKAFAEED